MIVSLLSSSNDDESRPIRFLYYYASTKSAYSIPAPIVSAVDGCIRGDHNPIPLIRAIYQYENPGILVRPIIHVGLRYDNHLTKAMGLFPVSVYGDI